MNIRRGEINLYVSDIPRAVRFICLADPDNNLHFLAQYLRDPLLPYPEKK